MRTQPSYLQRIRKKYNEIGEVWDRSDRWHAWSKRQIDEEMFTISRQFSALNDGSRLVVDVGSGGYSYFDSRCGRVEVDIAEARLRQSTWPVCASAESLPLLPGVSDLTICVGPVINYCSLEEALNEFSLVTKNHGVLVLHVELSNSWEFLGSKAYRADAAFVTTFYKGAEQYWVYSNQFVQRMLAAYGFKIERTRYFHILSSLAYRVSRSPNFSAYFAIADVLFRNFWLAPQVADSAIFVCRRVATE
ncbi:hypothetical protein SAMN05444158_7542 [Bradyrhizobium canariense]|uniref:Methyltransferase type 11 domain-containing protein n=1 Tax=Bradyrhizobium canariense TaxID=255045 RepID=A0A1H2BU96_9BRAD|nr:hypothetical protein SAMN05444158_0016 [Bradyrhizobium canariense]SDT61694.1 hypothetical protein SAMN05444158_7542 [Bradyrhizobium canariense]